LEIERDSYCPHLEIAYKKPIKKQEGALNFKGLSQYGGRRKD
jgi:hypothetical protein